MPAIAQILGAELGVLLAAPSPALAEGGGFNPFEFAPGAAIWTIVIFVLALVPMWKFVFGPITKALDERDRKVDEALAAAERARKEAEEQTAATRAELEKARHEARQMVQEATARAERQAQDELARARVEAERQLQQARTEIDAQKRKALEEIRREVVGLAVGSAGAILKRDVDDAAHRQFVTEFLGGAKR
ncbi:MAG: F0F1 ATP synthase subunit B [Planctomycetes bacterium]|nr:F0F1 ATP synthase subunit B [Planctomycetota bacterium]